MTNLDDFLERKKRKRTLANLQDMTGTFVCQDDMCLEVVSEAFFDVDTSTVVWYCSKKHESEIKL
jgi:hypothetical protein